MLRIRRRLDGLEAHAHQTMAGADELVGLAKDLVADLADGVRIELELFGRTIPLVVRIDPAERDER